VVRLERIERELPSLRTALDLLLERADAPRGVRLTEAIGPFRANRGLMAEGRRWFSAFLGLDQLDGRLRGRDRAGCPRGAALLALRVPAAPRPSAQRHARPDPTVRYARETVLAGRAIGYDRIVVRRSDHRGRPCRQVRAGRHPAALLASPSAYELAGDRRPVNGR
jgi:hypothetical protein